MRRPRPYLPQGFFTSTNAWLLRGKPWLLRCLLCVPVCALLLVWHNHHFKDQAKQDPVTRTALWMYDSAMRAWSSSPERRAVDARIVVVGIDEHSLKHAGRWPWPREQTAQLIDQLFTHYQIRLLGLDVVFAEPQDPRTTQADRRLAQSLQNRPIVLGYYLTHEPQQTGHLPEPWITQDTQAAASTPNFQGFVSSLPLLAQASAKTGAGAINGHPDVDGLHRRVPLVLKHQDVLYPSLPLAMLHTLTGQPHGVRDMRGLLLTTPQINNPAPSGLPGKNAAPVTHGLHIPLDERGQLPLAFRGVPRSAEAAFTHISAADVLAKKIPSAHLRGKVVLLGATAAGLGDLRATPLRSLQPGVELHALALANLLDSIYLQPPAYAAGVELVLILITAALLLWALPKLSRRSSLFSLAFVGALCALYLDIYRWAFTQGWVLPLASSLILTVALYVLHATLGFWQESLLRDQLLRILRRYAPSTTTSEGLTPESRKQSVQLTHLTVMFCDIRGFSELSNHLSPQDLHRVTQAVFERITACVHQSGGMVDKYLGDSVMAFWGHEVGTTRRSASASPHHAQQAVHGALAILQELAAWRSQNDGVAGARAQIAQTMRVGIGINTGAMLVGDIGTRERASFSVMGDAVNVASRLQELTRQHDGVDLLVGAATARAATEQRWHSLGEVSLRGRSDAVEVFKLG